VLPPSPQELELRHGIVAAARWGIANRGLIHYTMGPARSGWLFQHPPVKPPKLPISTDCSGYATLCYWTAGADDPNGLHYQELGYTGTLLNHCRLIDPKHALPGDLIVYGPGTGHHVAVILGADGAGNVEVGSHGDEHGPVEILNYLEAAAQPHPVRWLRSPQFAQ
jgi:cell wall-associated NlpC family hydrolase